MVGVPLPVPGSLLVEEPDVGHPEEAVQESNHHLSIRGGVNKNCEAQARVRQGSARIGKG